MNILILGLGTAGKHYLSLVKKMNLKKKIFFFDPFKKENNNKIKTLDIFYNTEKISNSYLFFLVNI